MNIYAYVRGDPVNGSDPSGTDGNTIGELIITGKKWVDYTALNTDALNRNLSSISTISTNNGIENALKGIKSILDLIGIVTGLIHPKPPEIEDIEQKPPYEQPKAPKPGVKPKQGPEPTPGGEPPPIKVPSPAPPSQDNDPDEVIDAWNDSLRDFLDSPFPYKNIWWLPGTWTQPTTPGVPPPPLPVPWWAR